MPDAGPKNKQQELHRCSREHGYTGVVATNTEQEYARYLRPGDRVQRGHDDRVDLGGEGHRPRHRLLHRDAHATSAIRPASRSARSRFRVLKFKPAQRRSRWPQPATRAPATPRRLRAPRAHDNGWWWEAVDRGELLIQQCSECGRLRHPPRPMCAGLPVDGLGRASLRRDAERVYSYVVMRHPPIPGYDYPLPVAVIDLEEGTRIVSNVVGCKPEDVHIGMKVQLSIENVDDGHEAAVLPAGGLAERRWTSLSAKSTC